MRLVNADTLEEQIKKCYCESCEAEKQDYNHVRCRACEAGDMLDWLEDAPTIDAVEVVRWKDCKYSRTNGKLYECPFFDEIRGDEFCSSGERKDGAKMTEGEND